MEIKIYNDTVSAATTMCDTKLELPIETEILIPDYLPQVFKVVKCFAHLVVLQKQMSTARLMLDGYLRITVFYQSEDDEQLCHTEQKMPFTKQVDLPQGEFFCPDITIGGEIEYINCRAVNQRRIDIRGAYALSVNANAQTTYDIVSSLSECGVQQKMNTLSGLCTLAVQEKVISAEDTIEFETQPDSVLDVSSYGSVNEVKIISGKAVLKGSISAKVLYKADELHNVSKTVDFNEVLEVEGADETCESIAFVKPTGCSLLASDDGKTTIAITAILYIKVFKQNNTFAVSDAFSTLYETKLDFDKVYTQEALDRFNVQIETSTEGNLPDEQATILAAFATQMQPELIEENSQSHIRGRVIIHVLCRNSLGEIDCYDKACEYVLPGVYDAKSQELILTANVNVLNVSAKKAGKTTSASVLLKVEGMLTKRKEYTVLKNIENIQELIKEDENIALRIYYAQEGEHLFDIARRYSVSPTFIAQTNELDGEIMKEAKHLLVPENSQKEEF